tara:strand:- start:7685 stop:8515 length:831 start_codon:yes stop_codon:yes gene_type:complete
MKTGFSANAFTRFSLFDAIDTISGIGYEGIEIVVDEPHAFLPLTNNEIKRIHDTLNEKELSVSNLNANTVVGWYSENKVKEKFEPSLSNMDNKLREWRIDYTKKTIDIANELNAPSICVTSGIKNYQRLETEVDFFKKSLLEILEYAEKSHVTIGIEYEPGLLVENSESVFELSKDFKNLGLNLDTCHVKVCNEDFSDIIQKFRNKIIHTHISDCKNNEHYHLIPGHGEIDFVNIIKRLTEINYDGYLTAELYTYSDIPEEAASETFIFLKNLINN